MSFDSPRPQDAMPTYRTYLVAYIEGDEVARVELVGSPRPHTIGEVTIPTGSTLLLEATEV